MHEHLAQAGLQILLFTSVALIGHVRLYLGVDVIDQLELSIVLSVAHDAVEERILKVLWIQVLVKIDYIDGVLLRQDVKKTFARLGSLTDSSSKIIFHVVNATLMVSYSLGSTIFSLLINRAYECIEFLDQKEALSDSGFS